MNFATADGFTALRIVIGNLVNDADAATDTDIARLLLQHGAHISFGCLLSAIAVANIEQVGLLLDHSPDMDINVGGGALPLLHRAVEVGHVGLVRLFLERPGINVDQETGEGLPVVTALYVACILGNVQIAELLLDHAADVNKVGGFCQ